MKRKVKPPTRSQLRRIIATAVARKLFTGGTGKTADRLELKEKDLFGGERGLGGWCFGAVVDQVDDLLRKYQRKLR